MFWILLPAAVVVDLLSERRPYRFVAACPHMRASFITYFTDSERTFKLQFDVFAEICDLQTLPPRRQHRGPKVWSSDIASVWSHLEGQPPGFNEEDIEDLSSSSHVTYFMTKLPSGEVAFYLVHSGVEYLFVKPGVDLDVEYELLGENR